MYKENADKDRILTSLQRIRKMNAKKLKKQIDPEFDMNKDLPKNDFFNTSFIKKERFSKRWHILKRKSMCYKSKIPNIDCDNSLNLLSSKDKVLSKKYSKQKNLMRFGGLLLTCLLDISSYLIFDSLIKAPFSLAGILASISTMLICNFFAIMCFDFGVSMFAKKHNKLFNQAYTRESLKDYAKLLLADLAIAELEDKNTRIIKSGKTVHFESKRQFMQKSSSGNQKEVSWKLSIN